MDSSTKLHIHQQKKIKEVKELMTQLIDATNTMGMDEEVAQGIFEGLVESHRTLQQSFMRSFTLAMKDYANTRTDLRNQASVDLAKKITELDVILPTV